MITYRISEVPSLTYRRKWMRINAVGFRDLRRPLRILNNDSARCIGLEIRGLSLQMRDLFPCGFQIGPQPSLLTVLSWATLASFWFRL